MPSEKSSNSRSGKAKAMEEFVVIQDAAGAKEAPLPKATRKEIGSRFARQHQLQLQDSPVSFIVVNKTEADKEEVNYRPCNKRRSINRYFPLSPVAQLEPKN